MAKCKCLIDGNVEKYNAAFRLDYAGDVADELIFMGIGVIVEALNKPYHGTERLKFYRTFKIEKYTGRR